MSGRRTRYWPAASAWETISSMTSKAPLQINPSAPTLDLEQIAIHLMRTDAEAPTADRHGNGIENMTGKKTAKTKGASLPPNWWSQHATSRVCIVKLNAGLNPRSF